MNPVNEDQLVSIQQTRYSIKTFKLCFSNFILVSLAYIWFYVVRLLLVYNIVESSAIWYLGQLLVSLYPLSNIILTLGIKKYMRKGIIKMLLRR